MASPSTFRIPPEEAIEEHAYLVARGVRALALVGHCPAEPLTMLRVATRLEALAVAGSTPFVIDRGDGYADYGYAAAAWALDLFRWATTSPAGSIPQRQRHRVIGLLLGYSAEAIRRYEEEAPGRLFEGPSSASPERAAS